MECLDANGIQDLMSGALDDTGRARAVAHLDGCEDCRGLVSLLARDATRTAALETLHGAATVSPKSLALRATEDAAANGRADSDARTRNLSTVTTADQGGLSPAVSLIMKSGTRQIGKTFGRYTLVDRIGAGAMGVVYRADDPGLNRRVALKLLHKPDQGLTDRLIREARSMAQVNHPNVVQVYDAGVEGGSTYIAMELVTGSSLRVWQQGKRTVPEILEMYVAAGRGLAAAHAAGIVHRDFKPDNCLVGSDARVRVTDFGLASARLSEDSGLDAGMNELELTHSGMVLGTPAYMSPEQFTGGNVDPRTDQFNYCVALYEALYGHRPFKGKTFDELGDNVCDGKVQPAPSGSRVSRALRAILLKGLSVRPGDRYATMDELLEHLGDDRARKWRITSIGAALLAATLGLGIGADFIVRERVSHENSQSFEATGVQLGRAFELLVDRFDSNANQMYHQFAMRDVTNYRDQEEFGLGTAESDAENRETIAQTLESSDWDLWHRKLKKGDPTKKDSIIAVADYKGRMLFTEAPRPRAKDQKPIITDLMQIDWLREAIASQRERTMVLQPTTDPGLRKTQIIGDHPSFQLAFFFARTLFLNEQPSGTLVQAVDATSLVDDIRLDDQIMLSIVSLPTPGEQAIADLPFEPARKNVPHELIQAALDAGGAVVEVTYDGVPFQVKSETLVQDFSDRKQGNPTAAPTKTTIGHVVMARELGGVLSGFFPGARTVFSLAALLSLLASIATFIQVRRLTR